MTHSKVHARDCTCMACTTIRALVEALSDEAKIGGAWMIAKNARQAKLSAVDHLNRIHVTSGDLYEEAWADAIGTATDYQEACTALVDLLIERMEK